MEIRETDIYQKWFDKLKDKRAKARILTRIRRVSLGNFGDVEPVGKSVSELKINYGCGYRVYFLQKKNVIVILLCGGDKSTQARDIRRAQEIAEELKGN